MAVSNATPTGLSIEKRESPFQNENVRAVGLFLLSLAVFLLVWEVGARAGWFVQGVPTATETIQEFWWWVTHPFLRQWS